MTYEFSVSPADFDLSLLPPNARRIGSSEFGEAVHNYLKRQFEGFGGTARIVVSDKLIEVTWNPDSEESDPLQAAIEQLKRGRYPEAIQLMELLRRRDPADARILYNLGMALSDTDHLDRSVEILQRLISLDPGHANGRVALGVALNRHGRTEEAVKELRAAVTTEPNNPYAWRNLGACLLKIGEMTEGEGALRRALQLTPADQQAWFGLAEAFFVQDRSDEADELFRKVVDLDPSSNIAELARGRLGEIAQAVFRSKTPDVERLDAVMYLIGAIKKFERMSREEVKKIGFEVATLGMRGLDVNDSTQKYQLRSLPGKFSGLHMVSLMFAAFKIIDPTADIGFDLSREYAEAMRMKEQWKG